MKLKMSTVLEEADQDLQITGSYLSHWDDDDKKAEGYCAMGLLACASESVEEGGWIGSEDKFLKDKYGLTKPKLSKIITCPECVKLKREIPAIYTLITTIIHMNDEHRLTYKQIAKHLKKMKL